MIVLVQRVLRASVEIDNEVYSAIDNGILLFVAIQKQDDMNIVSRMSEKVLAYRVFADEAGKMNKNVIEMKNSVLAVPQFTLAADTNKGLRPNFSQAAPPEQGNMLFDCFLNTLKSKYVKVKAGKFGADMQIHLINDGPVTFWLQI